MISHYISITVLLLSTLALQAISMPWDNQASSPSSSSSSLKNHEQSRLVSLRPRSSLGSSAINAMRLGNDPSNTHLLDINDIALATLGGGPIARHPVTGEIFEPPVAHLATGVSEMHKDRLIGKGVRIGIIDTGVDYRHPALGGNNPATRRVLFGRDFVGNNYDGVNRQPSDDPMDCAGHGTMVAGIIGAVTNTYTGVAPGAILGAYKVFGCTPISITTKIIEDAMYMAYRNGMDIVNISFGFEPEMADALAKIMQEYTQLNMVIIAAVPNYEEGSVMGWDTTVPNLLPTVISVGSMTMPYRLMDSFHLYYSAYQEEITYRYVCSPWKIPNEMPTGIFSVVTASLTDSGKACYVPVGTGDSIVAVPNECNTAHFFNKLYEHGASAIITSNLRSHVSSCTVPIVEVDSNAISKIKQLSTQKTPTEVTFLKNKKIVPQLDRIVGSSWSAWGPTANLRLSPDIVAPGESLVVTMNGKYDMTDGTSFAAPYLAGIAALYFEHCDKNGKTRPNYSQLRSLLQNNAIPYMIPGKNLAGSVAHQGAGMAHIDRMVKRTFSAWPSAIELLDIKQRPTSDYTKSGSITINNFSNSRRTFYLRHIPAVSMRAFHANGEAAKEVVTTDVHIETSITGPQVITLKPRDKASIPITFTIPKELNYDEHWVYSGYIVIDTEPLVNGRPPSDHAVYVPYLGLNGNIETIHKFFEIRSHSFQR